ncbi:MAG: hypothetical protein WB586_24495 [Chthoniobacterales bacterium]
MIDIDDYAMEFLDRKATEIGVRESLTLHRANVFRLSARRELGIPPIDFAYSLGLIDYFDDRHVESRIRNPRGIFRWESMAGKVKRTYGVRRGSRKVGKRIDWFWEAYWKENGRDVSRRFSENAYGDGIAERRAREVRLAAEERLPNLRRNS